MDLPKYCRILALWLSLGVLSSDTISAQEIPTVESLRTQAAAREAALTKAVSAKYSTRVKQLPGSNAWVKFRVANHTLNIRVDQLMPDNSIVSAYDCQLALSRAQLRLVKGDPTAPANEVDFQTNGKRSWQYHPQGKAVFLLDEPLSPQSASSRHPWLPAYLTLFPTSMSQGTCHGPTLSELLDPAAGNRARITEGEGGDRILEIRSAIKRSPIPHHEWVRIITLGKEVGYLPTHYLARVEVGPEVFAPSFEVRYEDFRPEGGMQIPRRMIMVTTNSERVHGQQNDPLKVTDFEDFQTEELTVTVDDLTTTAVFAAGIFDYRFPPGTTITKSDLFPFKLSRFLIIAAFAIVTVIVAGTLFYFGRNCWPGSTKRA